MITLSKLYLELANVVPADCISVREIRLQQEIDRYGVALHLISEGHANPRDIAERALNALPLLPETTP